MGFFLKEALLEQVGFRNLLEYIEIASTRCSGPGVGQAIGGLQIEYPAVLELRIA
jgi:hypothetical protein